MKSVRDILFFAVITSLMGLVAFVPAVQATTFVDANFTETEYATGLDRPTAMEFAPDGRLFVTQQDGKVRVIDSGVLLPTPFVDVQADDRGERGLSGITFDPNFEQNGYVYLHYTVDADPQYNQVSRFSAFGNVAQANSEVVIMRLDDLPAAAVATNHNGGSLQFGVDGKLYVAVGDGGSGFAENSQDLTNRFGSILRINRDGSIPTDNPFYDTLTGENRAIWAYGLRNPYTVDIQPTTGIAYINDVGQNTWEEINLAAAGANYGWPDSEGETNMAGITNPIYVYPHVQQPGGVCAITGGAFYNPPVTMFPAEYVGDYLFMDYCAGWIQRYDAGTDTATDFASATSRFAVDIEAGPDGAVYYVSRETDSVYRITYAVGSTPPAITANPGNASVGVGEEALFTCAASGTEPITYQWQRNGVDIQGATGAGYLIEAVSVQDDSATFQCVATNGFGTATSTAATLDVVDSTPPQAQIQITLPNGTDSERYEVGKSIQFSGSATDPDAADQNLPDSAFDWRVVFYENGGETITVVNPLIAGARSSQITAASQGTTATDVWYRVYLRVTDSSGLTHIVYQDVFPLVVTFDIDTNVAGLSVELDGQLQQAPFTADSIAGVTRSLRAPESQQYNGQTYTFQSWSTLGTNPSFSGVTPAQSGAVTANYRAVLEGNLVTNFDFLQDEAGYAFVGAIERAVNDGVLEISRTGGTQAVFGQVFAGVNMMAGTNLEATIDLGNSGTTAKNIAFLIADVNDYTAPQNILRCEFTVPPFTQLQTYTLRGSVPVNWQTAAAGISLEDTTAGNLLVDNFIVTESDATNAPALECVPAAAANTNLVSNAGFDANDDGYIYFGSINRNMNSGTLEISRSGAGGVAIVAQVLGDVRFTSGSKLVATVDLGSASTETKQATLILANPDTYPAAGSTVTCAFDVPANTQPATFTMETVVPADWDAVAVGVDVLDMQSGNLLVDNFDVQYQPESMISGTVCTPLQVGSSSVVEAASTTEETSAPMIESAAPVEASVPVIESAVVEGESD